jgi:hypothetical protein
VREVGVAHRTRSAEADVEPVAAGQVPDAEVVVEPAISFGAASSPAASVMLLLQGRVGNAVLARWLLAPRDDGDDDDEQSALATALRPLGLTSARELQRDEDEGAGGGGNVPQAVGGSRGAEGAGGSQADQGVATENQQRQLGSGGDGSEFDQGAEGAGAGYKGGIPESQPQLPPRTAPDVEDEGGSEGAGGAGPSSHVDPAQVDWWSRHQDSDQPYTGGEGAGGTRTDSPYPAHTGPPDPVPIVAGVVTGPLFTAAVGAGLEGVEAVAGEVGGEATGVEAVGDATVAADESTASASETATAPEAETEASPSSGDVVEDAYDVAAAGGKNAGFLRNYLNRPTIEIQRGIRSIEKVIAEHENALVNPEGKIPKWNTLSKAEQQSLLTKVWPSQLERQRAQLAILKGILRSRGL